MLSVAKHLSAYRARPFASLRVTREFYRCWLLNFIIARLRPLALGWPECAKCEYGQGAINRAATNDFVYIRSSGTKPRTRSALFMVCTVARTNKVRNDFTRSSASLRIGGVCS